MHREYNEYKDTSKLLDLIIAEKNKIGLVN